MLPPPGAESDRRRVVGVLRVGADVLAVGVEVARLGGDARQLAIAHRVGDRESTVGLPLRRGRDFGPSDLEGGDRVDDYFARNPGQPYCQVIIEPRVAKLRKQHLGPVDIHRVARTDPTRWIIAAKLVSVLS